MGIEFYLAANILGIFRFIFSCRIDLPLFSSHGRCHANCGISPPLTAQTEIRFENRVSLTSCCVIFHLISPSFPYQFPFPCFHLLGWRGADNVVSGERGGNRLRAAGTEDGERARDALLFLSSSCSWPSKIWGKGRGESINGFSYRSGA